MLSGAYGGVAMNMMDFFEKAEKKVKKDLLSGTEREKSLKKLASLKVLYTRLDPAVLDSPLAQGLLERGEKVLSQSPLKYDALGMLLRQVKAAWYDLSDSLGAYRWYVRCFFMASIGFFLLAPQFFPVVLALLFIVPVFLGLKGLKRRSINGFTMSAMLFPVALLAATMGLRSYLPAITGDLQAKAAELAILYGTTSSLATGIILVSAILSTLTVAASVGGALVGFLNRDLFL